MPAGITSVTTPSSSNVLGVLSTKPKETPPTLGGGNWLTMGAWNKPPTGQTLTDYNAWLNRIGMPQNTFGQFMINPTTGQYALPNPTTPNAMGGINTSKPSYQTFPLYNQPTQMTYNNMLGTGAIPGTPDVLQGGTFPMIQVSSSPTTVQPTAAATPINIYTPDMPNYVGGEYNQTTNQPSATLPTTSTPTTTTPRVTATPTTAMRNQWLAGATRAGYNPTRMLGYYTRNRRIIP